MGYALLWIENLAVSLLLVAFLFACIGRRHRRWLRNVLWIAVLLVLLSAYCICAVFAFAIQFKGALASWFWPALGLAIAFLVGAVWLVVRGLWHVDGADTPTVAGGWPRGRLAIVLGVAVALHLITLSNLDLSLRQQMAVYRAQAVAVALSVAPARVPDPDNAAIVYEEAFKCLPDAKAWEGVAAEKQRRWWGTPWQPGFDAKDPQLRRFLESQAGTIVLLHTAAAKPGCYFEHDYYWPSIFDLTLPELDGFRETARLLALDACAKAADGQNRAALQDVNTLLLMLQHTGSGTEPSMISVLTSAGIESIGLETLQHILKGRSVSADDLAVLRIDDVTSFHRLFQQTVRWEEAFRLAAFCEMGSQVRDAPRILGPLKDTYLVLVLADGLADHDRMSRQLRAMAAKPYYEARAQWKELPKQLKEARNAGFIVRRLVPTMDSCCEVVARADARWQAAELGVAAYRYRAKYDRYPEKLADLVPDFVPRVPPDPFDGQPMRMRRTEQGLIVYSIGSDMADNGGAALDEQKQAGDITFEVAAPTGGGR